MSVDNGPSGLPATLRRRYMELMDERDEQFCRVFQHAADEPEARRRHASEGEAAMVQLVADNRRLRNALVEIRRSLRVAPVPGQWAADLLQRIIATLNACKEPFVGRLLLTVDMSVHGATRELAEARVKAAFDEYFAPKPDDVPTVAEAE